MAELFGTPADDILVGTSESDTISGLDGNDVIDGVMGTDNLFGGNGNDRFVFSGIKFTSPEPQVGTIDGGNGFDEIDVSNLSPTAIYSEVLSLGNQKFELLNIERVRLGSGNNYISASNVSYEIISGSGNDRLTITGAANVNAGAGNDYFFVSPSLGSKGAEFTFGTLNGGDGVDTLATNILAEVDLEACTAKVWNASYTISGFENVTVTGYDNNTTVRGDGESNVIAASDTSYAGVSFDGRGGNDLLTGSIYADTLRGGNGADRISGLGGSDFIFGDNGNDVIDALGDGDTIDGGNGFDIVKYLELTRAYTVSSSKMGATVSSGSSADRISTVENVEFRDATLTFDADSNAAYVMRLYGSVLNREPDAVGLDSWLDRMDRGLSKVAVAEAFVGSPEFARVTGSLSTPDFVEFLYTSALGRSSDAAGKANWVANIDAGLSRAEAVIGFSESNEHRALTSDTLAKGLWITDENFQQVAALYDSFADRLPDKEGLLNWVSVLELGTSSLKDVADGFANSVEFSQKTAGLSNEDLVEYMYQNTLDRGADPGGKQAWVRALEGGMTKGELLLGFSSSEEHFTLIRDHIYSGVEFLI